MTDMAMNLADVTRRVGGFRLGPITLAIPRGGIFGLCGPNGAGKTTLMDTMMGFGPVDGGRMAVLGCDPLREEVAVKQRVAYVGPDFVWDAWGTVDKALRFVARFYPDWQKAREARLLADLALDRHAKIATLSTGQKTRLQLVMAFSREAEILLLDEPTLGLDAAGRRVLNRECLAVVRDPRRTVVVSTHDLAELERFADTVAILAAGRIVLVEAMAALAERFLRVFSAMAPESAGITAMPGAAAGTWLVDRAELDAAGRDWLSRQDGTVPLTLEEILLAVTGAEAVA